MTIRIQGNVVIDNSRNATVSSVALPQNPVGSTYGNSVTTPPPHMISQIVGNNDGWRLYGEAAATNQVRMVFELIDDIEEAYADQWVFRNKRTYNDFIARNEFQVSGTGNAQARSSMRGPIFFDSNNTNYYIDPNATTAIRTVGAWLSDSGSWSGDAGSGVGKIQYYSNRWYINAGANSNRIVQFRRGGTDRSWIDNNGVYRGTATDANRLVVPDTRGANDQPQAKAGKRITADFKFNTAVGSPPVTASGTYSHIITVAGWNTNEASGGWPTQLSIGAAGIAYRQATSATAWGGWNATVNTSGNQSISGTKTHTGIIRLNASGIYLRQDSTSSFGDSAGSGWGKIQYHSNRWYINAGSNSTEIIQFRRGSSNVGNISNSGDLTMSGNITAYSDIKLKENIKVIPKALKKILSVRGVTYNRKDVEGKPRQAGVIAQEIEKILPEVIETSTDENGETTKSVAYGNLAGIFIEAIKELKKEKDKEIKELQQKILSLEKKNK